MNDPAESCRRLLRILLPVLLLLAGPAAAKTQTIAWQTLTQEVTERLQGMLDQEGGGYKVLEVIFRNNLEVAEGPMEWKIIRPPEPPSPGRRERLTVHLSAGGAPPITLNPEVRLGQRVRILTSRRNLKQGETILPEDLEEKELDITYPKPELLPVEQGRDLLHQTATRGVRAGIPLEKGWFELPWAVKRGDRLRVTLAQRSLLIETEATATVNGRVGDQIAVTNSKTMKRFQARVVAPGEAVVEAP